MPALGDFVYIYWDVGTQYGPSGRVTGAEYTADLETLLDDGFGTLTTKPANWEDSFPYNPQAGVPAKSPNAALSAADVDKRIARNIVVSATQPVVASDGGPILWVKDFGNSKYALAIVTGD